MPNPSIIADLLLRDLTAPEVAKVAASIQQTLSGISVELLTPQSVQQSLRGIEGITRAGKEASSSLISLSQVFKDPGLLQAYVEQRRALEELKAEANRGISTFASPREFLSTKDVLRDEKNYQQLLGQTIELEKLKQKLRTDVRAVVSPLTEGVEQKKLAGMHAQALAENVAFDEKRAAEAKRGAAKLLTIEEEAQLKLAAIRRRGLVRQALMIQALPHERDALGKVLGRSNVTVEDPFGSLVTPAGIKARFSSVFAGQVGSLLVYGSALRGTISLVQNYISANTELEDSLARVSTVLEGSAADQGKQYARLRAQAIEWGRTHAQSAKDAADAMYFLLSAGESVSEAQRNLPAVLNLSYGGFLDSAFAAETAATAYELFSKEGLSMVDIVNKIQKTANITQVTVEQFASAFNYAASTADQAKIPLEDLSAAIGTLGTLGLRGSKGGRNLDEAIGQLLRKKDDLRSMGVDIEDVSGNMKSLGDIILAFREKLGSRIDVSELKLLREIFGQQGGRAFGLLIENADLYFDTLSRIKTTQGEIFETAFKRGDTLSQLWERWKNQWQAIAQEGRGLNEVLKAILGGPESARGRDFIVNLIGGDQGAEGMRAAIRKLGEQTGIELDLTLEKLRTKFSDKQLFTDETIATLFDTGIGGKGIFFASDADLAAAKAQAMRFLEKMADDLANVEGQEKFRSVIADVLSIKPDDLKGLVLTSEDIEAIKKDARAGLERLIEELSGIPIGPAQLVALNALREKLAGFAGDKLWRKPVDEIAQTLARFAVNVSRAQLDALRSIPTGDFKERLQIIDVELLVNLRKNQEEYLRAIESLPKDMKKGAPAYAEAVGLLKKELSFKDITDVNKAALAIVQVRVEAQFGEAPVAKLKKELAQARLELAKAVPETLLPLRAKLQLIDDETLLKLERNKQEYIQKISSLPKELLLGQRFGDMRDRLVHELDSVSGGIGESKGKMDAAVAAVRGSMVELFGALPVDDTSFDAVRKSILAEVEGMQRQVPASFDMLKARVLGFFDSLPKEMLSKGGQLQEAMDALKEILSVKDLTVENEAFFAKDKQIREEFLRSWESDVRNQQHTQDMLLDEQHAGDETRRKKRNESLRKELLGLSGTFIQTPRIPAAQLYVPTQSPLEQIAAQLAAVRQMESEIGKLNLQLATAGEINKLVADFTVADGSAGSVKRLTDGILALGDTGRLSAVEVKKLLDVIEKLKAKIDPSAIDIVHGFGDALGSLSGAMQELGNWDTWSNVAKGVGVVESSIVKLFAVAENLKLNTAMGDLMGGLGIASVAFNIIGLIASLTKAEEERKNLIGIEEYKYQAGRNVSANYGRAQTINVQVDLNPNFNLLDPSQLTAQRQREIAYELGNEIDDYFEDTGRFVRR